jgi:hypothetical protein
MSRASSLLTSPWMKRAVAAVPTRSRTGLVDRAGDHVDAGRLPPTAGEVEGVAFRPAAQIECAATFEPMRAFEEFD